MNDKLTKKAADRIMKTQGEVRGVVLKTDHDYILKREGEPGVMLVEKKLEEVGYPLKYSGIKTMDFYPVGLRALSLLAIKEIFNLSDKDIEEMGMFATKISLIIKLFMQYFLSIERVVMKEAPKMWRKHWTKGRLVPVELNEKERYVVLRVVDFDLHPVYCIYLKGYFAGILSMIVKSVRKISQETKCVFRGGKYHEYTIRW